MRTMSVEQAATLYHKLEYFLGIETKYDHYIDKNRRALTRKHNGMSFHPYLHWCPKKDMKKKRLEPATFEEF